jgi:hypothetical protein
MSAPQIIDAIYEQDPNGATLAFADMMKKQIVMPAHLMDDGQHETTNKGRNLFAVSADLACSADVCLWGALCGSCAVVVMCWVLLSCRAL